MSLWPRLHKYPPIKKRVPGSSLAPLQTKNHITMKEYIFEELGYFCEQDCIKIKEAIEGRTYMQFSVGYSNYAGNCTLIIKTDYEDTEEHIKMFFLHCLITSFTNK